jgi:two-component system, OmpR family, phosphate regulon sensor histidine kinase PhoR
MVNELRDKLGIPGQSIDIILPDLPPDAGVVAVRAFQRLYYRRWVAILPIAIIILYTAFYHLPLLPAFIGSAAIIAGAAFLPRESIFRQALPLTRSEPLVANHVLDAMLEGLPAPVMVLDAQTHVLRFNGQAKEMFPALRENQRLSAFLRDPAVLDGVALASNSRVPRQIVRHETRVPIERHVDVTIAWIGAVHGKSPPEQAAILLYLQDLTAQEALNSMRTDFIANASHELRTPLASVLGFIETLQGPAREDTNARERFLTIMARQAKRMARLIDDLLSLSRIEMHQHVRPQNNVDLVSLIDHVIATLKPHSEKTDITLHRNSNTETAEVLGDRDELEQVFSNLIENAIKYGRPGGNVWVSIKTELQGGITVSVRDDGRGIAPRHLPRLTERFYRATDEFGEKTGTGLGLAIVKHAVNRHRGELYVTSEANIGSEFTVTLQMAPKKQCDSTTEG